MQNNILVFRDEEIEETIRGLDRATVNLSDTSQNIPSKFNQMTNTGLFSGGLNKINKQINSLTTSITGIESTLKKQKNQMIESEINYKKKAEQIEIPRDFINNEAREVHTIDDIYLQKKDGISVNVGQETKIVDDLKEYTIIEENLGSIANLRETEKQNVDNSTRLNKTIINNISNSNITTSQMYNDNSMIQKEEIIYNLNTNNSGLEQSNIDENIFKKIEKNKLIEKNILQEFEELRW